MKVTGSIACVLALLVTTARADDFVKVAPAPGRDPAPVRPPPWCAGIAGDGGSSMGALGRTLASFERGGAGAIAKAAEMTCGMQKEPAIGQAVAAIEQTWINYTGLAEADAVASIAARIDGPKWKAAKASLCDGLAVSEEWGGEERVFMVARRDLFGCSQPSRRNGANGDKEPLWIEPVARLEGEVMHYVDLSSTPPDELVRVATILADTFYTIRTDKPDAFEAARYIVGQYDFKALSRPAMMQLLATAPYQGNVYAHTVVLESLARATRGIAIADAEAARLAASDPAWKELLVTAPARGLADYQVLADKHKDALARSNAFEHTFFGPSRTAVKGCYAPLRADFLAIAKTLPHATAVAFAESVSLHPIASVLFTRLAACAAIDGQESLGQVLLPMISHLRASRGPRMAMYYAALDALTKIVVDRPKFPVAVASLSKLHISTELVTEAQKVRVDDHASFSEERKHKGIVQSVKKTAKGVELSFVKEKHQETVFDCAPTGQIISWQPNGAPNYYQVCKDPTLRTVDDTADGITIPTEWAAGIAPGAAVEFKVEIAAAPDRLAIPTAVYKDKARKALVNWFGFGL